MTEPRSARGLDWLGEPVAVLDRSARDAGAARQASLTKPPGSLGRLESLALDLCAMQGRERPSVDCPAIVVFAGDHGVAAEGVSAFPQSVTAEMVRNFARGGAAISVLARTLGARLEVVNVGTVTVLEALPGVVDARIGPGTGNIAREPAMNADDLIAALTAGRDALDRAVDRGADLFIGGDMGIANTTAASAVACVLLGAAAADLAGPGTGLDAAGVRRKAAVIECALQRHAVASTAPLDALRCLGGFEIAALAGAFVRGAQRGIPVLVDGFISSVAALAACRLQASAGDWMLLAHRSAEPGHARVVDALPGEPVLDLGMRLGEGSGAATALPIVRLACALHDGMATFDEAAVSARLHE